MTFSTRTPFAVRRVAVIGAGPTGLAAAKYLLARPSSFPHVVVFEQQTVPGGVWNYSSTPPPPPPTIPHTNPFCPPDPPVRTEPVPSFSSPMYENLHANIPSSLMRYSDQAFPEGGYLFPDREVIREYLVQYAEDVKHVIRFGWTVESVRLRAGEAAGGRDLWDVVVREVAGANVEQHTFDAVVVANGHFMAPFVPDIPGIREFHEAHPGVIQHSKVFRAPASFSGLKTMVVGNGSSGLDIARQMNHLVQKPLLLSVHHPTKPEQLAHAGCEEVPEIETFLPSERGVRLINGDVHAGLDAIVFCTGYMYSYSFLPDIAPTILKSGKCVHQAYRQLFHVKHPTLVFPGLLKMAIPFPMSEVQVALVAAVWANLLSLPSEGEMMRWCDDLARERGENVDKCEQGEDGRYLNGMHDWVASAADNGEGKEPPFWDDEKLWERSIYIEAKLRFEDQGCKAKTLDDLGLHYTPKTALRDQ